MLCSIKNHISTFISFLSLLAFSFLFSVVFSDNSHATSLSYTVDSSNYSSAYTFCDSVSSCSGLKYLYISLNDFPSPSSYSGNTSALRLRIYYTFSDNSSPSTTLYCYYFSSFCYFELHDSFSLFSLNQAYNWSSVASSTSSAVITLSDSSPFSSPSGSITLSSNGTFDVSSYSEAVVDVPPIPGDYHSDLVSLNNTLVLVPAVALVIFLLYLLNRIFIKGGDS